VSGNGGSARSAQLGELGVLEQIKDEIAELFGDAFLPGDIRVDVDVFEGGEPLVAGQQLDSMDLVQIIAVLEERFDVSLATSLSGAEPLTLSDVARHIEGMMS
jgi:acyl carrier protein